MKTLWTLGGIGGSSDDIPPHPAFRFSPGEIIDIEDDTEKCFRYLILEPRVVPDPDHQSSLDYLKGV